MVLRHGPSSLYALGNAVGFWNAFLEVAALFYFLFPLNWSLLVFFLFHCVIVQFEQGISTGVLEVNSD